SAALLVLVPAARADIGPKPTLDFEFVYETGTPLTITGGELLQCDEATCAAGEPLQELGPQRFSCTENACTSMAYGYSDYAQLVIRFSDGVTRKSQVFAIKRFHAHCRVTVREDDLWVEVQGKLFSPLASIMAGLLMVGVVVPLCLIITVWWASKAGKGVVTPKNARGIFITIWVLTVLVAGGGAFISLSVPLTFLIEGLLVLLYVRWRTHPPVALLTGVLLANLLTQPVFLFSLLSRPTWNFLWFGVAELCIWLVEAGVLHFTQRKTLSFKEALALSLFLNAISFGLGLLLPIPAIW
ncbi:MAG: hypothetical protein U9R05_10590, partial [Chloroflexota bacterium]|nr:hypothetical protein [Chloroflexota bacterium]